MSYKTKAIILDSWAVVAYLGEEEAGEKVAAIIADAHEKGISLKISVVNAGEVWYIIARQFSPEEADKAISVLHELAIELVNVNWAIAKCAASLKAKYKMSYSDCIAAALAENEKSELVTGDKEFKQVEKIIKIRWIE